MSDGDIILHSAPDGARRQLRASDRTVWLTQAEIATLYGTSVPNVTQTIAQVLADGETDEATIHSELRVHREGSRDMRRQVKVYNLDMAPAVEYRSSSRRAVQFRHDALGRHRSFGGGDHQQPPRSECRQHGAHDVARRACTQARRRHRQDLADIEAIKQQARARHTTNGE